MFSLNIDLKWNYSRNKPLKGTVSVISCDSPYKYGNNRFTAVPLKPWSDPNVEYVLVFLGLKVFYSDNS